MDSLNQLRTRLRHAPVLPEDADAFVACVIAASGEDEVEPVARRALGGSTEAALALWQDCGRPLPVLEPRCTHNALDLCIGLLDVLSAVQAPPMARYA